MKKFLLVCETPEDLAEVLTNPVVRDVLIQFFKTAFRLPDQPTPIHSTEEKSMRLRQAAKYVGTSESTFRRWLDDPFMALPRHRYPGTRQYFFFASELDAWRRSPAAPAKSAKSEAAQAVRNFFNVPRRTRKK